MPLRAGFDLDGTVADMYSALRREAIKLFGEEVIGTAETSSTPDEGVPHEVAARSPSTTARRVTSRQASSNDKVQTPKSEDDQTASISMQDLHLSARQQAQLWDHVKTIENFWTTLPELEPGIIARIAKNVVDRRWEVIFFTTRPATSGELVQVQSQRWLEAHGFQYPSVYVVQRSRGKIADALGLDTFVDDRPENCLDIAVESHAKVVLVWHGDPKEIPPGAKRLGVQPVTRISDAMNLLEKLDDIRNEPSLMRTIKKGLGIRD